MLISADELESLDETVDLLSIPGALEEIRKAEEEIARGEYVTAAEMAHLLAERRARRHRPA